MPTKCRASFSRPFSDYYDVLFTKLLAIYTVYRQTWDQFLILLVAEFLCFVLFVGATAMVEGVEKFSGWLRDLI